MHITKDSRIIVTDHAAEQFRARVDPQNRHPDPKAAITAQLRVRQVTSAALGETPNTVYLTLGNNQTGGWRAKCSREGDTLIVETITRRHGRSGNLFERQRNDRRSWQIWCEWCEVRNVFPVDSIHMLPEWAEGMDGKITQRTRKVGAVVRIMHAETLGVDLTELERLHPKTEIRSKTGKKVLV